MWSSPIVVVPPAAEPISIDEAKSFLRVDGDDLDMEVGRYAAGARASIESTTSTRMMPQTVVVMADKFADLARLPIGPVTKVVSVSYLDAGRSEQLLAPGTYELFGAGLEKGIRTAKNVTWPTIANVAGAVTVQLEVGYPDGEIPGDVVLALYGALRAKAEGTAADYDDLIYNHRIWLI